MRKGQILLLFCLFLWGGLPCLRAATVSQVLMGSFGDLVGKTKITITNREANQSVCNVGVSFFQGVTTESPPVLFNGQLAENNFFITEISRGGAEILTLTPANEDETVIGAVQVFTQSPCTGDSLHVKAGYILEEKTGGTIVESFSVNGQYPDEWLGDGDCRVLTGSFGNGCNVGLASITATGQGAPPGTQLNFRSFDLGGSFTGNPPSLPINGEHNASFPWDFIAPTTIEICLEVPGTGSDFKIATTTIGVKRTGDKFQFDPEIFADGFESGDTSAWSSSSP